MSNLRKLAALTIGFGAVLMAPAFAAPPYHYRVPHHVPYWHETHIPVGPRTGYKYFGPYNPRIVTEPNGTVIGTDPDSNVLTYMHRDNIGPNGTPGGRGR